MWTRPWRQPYGASGNVHGTTAARQRRAPDVSTTQAPIPQPLLTPAIGLRAALRKYFNIFRASLIERLAYRGDFLLGTFLRFLPMLTTILLWEAVYAGSGKTDLAGFTRSQM